MRTFRKDLEAGGVEYETPDGRLDFHALRTTMVTWCDLHGVPLAEAQKLARHCSPILTANHYTRLRLENLRGAVNRIGLSMPSSVPQTVPNDGKPCVMARKVVKGRERRNAAS